MLHMKQMPHLALVNIFFCKMCTLCTAYNSTFWRLSIMIPSKALLRTSGSIWESLIIHYQQCLQIFFRQWIPFYSGDQFGCSLLASSACEILSLLRANKLTKDWCQWSSPQLCRKCKAICGTKPIKRPNQIHFAVDSSAIKGSDFLWQALSMLPSWWCSVIEKPAPSHFFDNDSFPASRVCHQLCPWNSAA